MRTDDLIGALSDGLQPMPKNWLARQIALGAGMGAIISVFLMVAVLGLRPDLSLVGADWRFWTKIFYTFALAILGLWLVTRQGVPGTNVGAPARLIALPVIAIIVIAGNFLAQDTAHMRELIMGRSALTCPFAILALALPVFGGTMWALRRLAPVRLEWAGASAGFFAGSMGALVYSLYCTENAVPFVAVWYSLGIILTSLVGGLLGRTILRW